MKNVEEMLKGYYEKQKRIEYLKRKYERLDANIAEIERCISTANHTLEVVLPSQRYDIEKVSITKSGSSPQERALLDSEKRMEQKIKNFFQDKEDCLLERCELENQCEQVDVLLLILDDEEKRMCKLRFGEKKTYTMLGYDINLDRSTAARKLKKILEKLCEELRLVA